MEYNGCGLILVPFFTAWNLTRCYRMPPSSQFIRSDTARVLFFLFLRGDFLFVNNFFKKHLCISGIWCIFAPEQLNK